MQPPTQIFSRPKNLQILVGKQTLVGFIMFHPSWESDQTSMFEMYSSRIHFPCNPRTGWFVVQLIDSDNAMLSFLIQFNINYHCCEKIDSAWYKISLFLHKMEQMLRQERTISTVLASLSNLFCILNLHHDCFYPNIDLQTGTQHHLGGFLTSPMLPEATAMSSTSLERKASILKSFGKPLELKKTQLFDDELWWVNKLSAR